MGVDDANHERHRTELTENDIVYQGLHAETTVFRMSSGNLSVERQDLVLRVQSGDFICQLICFSKQLLPFVGKDKSRHGYGSCRQIRDRQKQKRFIGGRTNSVSGGPAFSE